MKIIRINQGKAIPFIIRILFLALLLGLILLVFYRISEPFSIIFGIALSFSGPAIWFATKLLAIDQTQKRVFKGIWTMGISLGKWLPYHTLQLQTQQRRTPQMLYNLGNRKNVLTDHIYEAFLLTNTDQKYYLFSHPDKATFQDKVNSITRKLAIESNK